MTIFEGTERRKIKMNITFSAGNKLPHTVFKFFPQKNPYRLNEIRKTGFKVTFSRISGSMIVTKNNTVHPRVDPDQPYITYYIYLNILTSWFCNQAP